MSDPTTWTLLKAWLADELNRTDMSSAGSGLTATRIETAIALAERHFQRSVFSPERIATADLTLNTEPEALPADCWGIEALHLTTDPLTVLEQMGLSDLRNRYSTGVGTPRAYAVRGENLILGPSPDGTYTGKLTYWQTIPALGSGQATNWLLTDHPNVYIYRSLFHLFVLLRDDTGMAFAKGITDELEAELNRSNRRRLFGQTPQRWRAPQVV